MNYTVLLRAISNDLFEETGEIALKHYSKDEGACEEIYLKQQIFTLYSGKKIPAVREVIDLHLKALEGGSVTKEQWGGAAQKAFVAAVSGKNYHARDFATAAYKAARAAQFFAPLAARWSLYWSHEAGVSYHKQTNNLLKLIGKN